MSTFAKVASLVPAVLAIAGCYLPLPANVLSGAQLIAVLLLAAHAVELLVAFKHIKRHPGPLVDSIALTLLFGVLHWLPLAKGRVAANDANA